MSTEFYKSYVDDLRETLTQGTKRRDLTKAFNFSESIQNKATPKPGKLKLSKEADERLFTSLQPLSSISGKKNYSHLRPGSHPDFSHLKDAGAFENHYICSVFIDVKRSTNLFRKYDPITVANIINTIQRAAVHTTWYFDGYIQRYHGDGLFTYFGGKNVTIQEAVRQALSANSFFSYFMRHDLKKLFNEQGIENIFTRIGMDIGEAEDVLWYQAGMGECSEITTCSLHTSLACKMQGVASSNGIVVGDNIKVHSLQPADLFQNVKDSGGKTDYYAFEILEEKFYYKQWDFNWERYMKNLPGVHQAQDGDMYIDTSAPAIISSNTAYLKSEGDRIKPWLG